ncbi:MAG: hypothetical protein CW341_05400 [Bacteroidetes bacterium]|nr:hypothetical protein [Bacteroidota bacterium]
MCQLKNRIRDFACSLCLPRNGSYQGAELSELSYTEKIHIYVKYVAKKYYLCRKFKIYSYERSET